MTNYIVWIIVGIFSLSWVIGAVYYNRSDAQWLKVRNKFDEEVDEALNIVKRGQKR